MSAALERRLATLEANAPETISTASVEPLSPEEAHARMTGPGTTVLPALPHGMTAQEVYMRMLNGPGAPRSRAGR